MFPAIIHLCALVSRFSPGGHAENKYVHCTGLGHKEERVNTVFPWGYNEEFGFGSDSNWAFSE